MSAPEPAGRPDLDVRVLGGLPGLAAGPGPDPAGSGRSRGGHGVPGPEPPVAVLGSLAFAVLCGLYLPARSW